jgi:hypothetical protein
MKLMLDHTQRLNLHALMGQQRANVDEVRIWWRLQDQIDLTAEEKEQINYRIGKIGEMEQPMWDVGKSLKPRAFEFSEDESKRIERIVKEWQPGFLIAGDRRWLEPLLTQLEKVDKVNGNAAPEIAVSPRNRPRVD